MDTDSLLDRFAATVVDYSLCLRPDDYFVIRTTPLAVPLVQRVYALAIKRGAKVRCNLEFDGQEEEFARNASEAQLDYVNPLDKLEAELTSARLFINAPYPPSGNAPSPERVARRLRAVQPITGIGRKRALTGDLRYCVTLFPTPTLALRAGMSLEEYQEFVYTAMFLDQAEPIVAWKTFSVGQQKKVDYLNSVSTLRFIAADTDLRLSVKGRTWMNSDGKRNFPSGEVFTGPVEDTVEGHIRFSFPSVRGAHSIEGVHLWFEKGVVVRAEAEGPREYLDSMLATDEGAKRLGEVAIGNNYGIQRFTGNTLFDEKIGGTCHIALGSSYPETGGRNESAIHWDMVCDMRTGGQIIADGAVIHENGHWTI